MVICKKNIISSRKVMLSHYYISLLHFTITSFVNQQLSVASLNQHNCLVFIRVVCFALDNSNLFWKDRFQRF